MSEPVPRCNACGRPQAFFPGCSIVECPKRKPWGFQVPAEPEDDETYLQNEVARLFDNPERIR